MQRAAFAIKDFVFNKVNINLEERKSEKIFVDFNPKGVFDKKECVFKILLEFKAFSDKDSKPFITIRCIGDFVFENVKALEDIPSFFYKNSIAILFPYLRAFVSMVTNQANIDPVILPTLNLTSLAEPLKENTKEV